MSKSVKLVMAFGLVAFAAACAQQEEAPVYIDPVPITVEPVYTGKYK